MNKCPACGSSGVRPFYSGLIRCQDCSHVAADVALTDEELAAIYRRSYFFGDEYSDYVAEGRILRKNFALRLEVLRRFLDCSRHRRLLEIGSAYGFFLDTAQADFESVLGIDITEDGVRYARQELKKDVIQGDFLSHDFGSRTFDVVCMWDTVEHLRDPRSYLEKVGDLTRSGTLLALTTGDIGSLNARMQKERWRLIHPPTHLHYFSKKSLAGMLKSCGFEILYNRHCGFYRSIDQMAYNILVLRKKKRRLYEFLEKTPLMTWDIYLNLYDILYVIARKR